MTATSSPLWKGRSSTTFLVNRPIISSAEAILALAARFAVQADADLHLVVAEGEGGRALAGWCRRSGEAHAPRIGIDPLRQGHDLLKPRLLGPAQVIL